jgi:hypothetical protein
VKKNTTKQNQPFRLRPFDESLPIVLAPDGEGEMPEKGKRRTAVLIWIIACQTESDETLQTMRAAILQRFPTLYLQTQDDVRAGRAPTQDSPEMLYWGSQFNPEKFQRDFGPLN